MTRKDQPNNGADTEAGNGEPTDDLSDYTLTAAGVGRNSA